MRRWWPWSPKPTRYEKPRLLARKLKNLKRPQIYCSTSTDNGRPSDESIWFSRQIKSTWKHARLSPGDMHLIVFICGSLTFTPVQWERVSAESSIVDHEQSSWKKSLWCQIPFDFSCNSKSVRIAFHNCGISRVKQHITAEPHKIFSLNFPIFRLSLRQHWKLLFDHRSCERICPESFINSVSELQWADEGRITVALCSSKFKEY